jgi:hypothetical protein
MREQPPRVRGSLLAQGSPPLPRPCRLAPLVLVCFVVCPAMLLAQQPAAEEVYQDFRNRRPLLPSLILGGPDIDSETKAEDEGLRITLPATRAKHWAVEVRTGFSLSGDFEITGTYELLSGERPTKGYGLGVHLNIADNDGRTKLAKIGRVMRVKEGSVYFSQYWHKDEKKDSQTRTTETQTKAGQLRLARIGPALHFLVSDGPGQEFRELYVQRDFGADELHHVRYGVSDSGSPGNPVDARLVDWRIRIGQRQLGNALEPAPLAVPAPPEAAPPLAKSRLAALLFIGLAMIFLVAFAARQWLVRQQRHGAGGSSA